MEIQESPAYQKLLRDVERDETRANGFHDYRAKLRWIIQRAGHYAEKTGIAAKDILAGWENDRSYWYMNYYQDSNQPEIAGDAVRVFDTCDDLAKQIGQSAFRCPCCQGVSRSPYECDSGILIDRLDGNHGPCDWKVYGLLRDLGQGVYVFVRGECRGERIFMPLAWENARPASALA